MIRRHTGIDRGSTRTGGQLPPPPFQVGTKIPFGPHFQRLKACFWLRLDHYCERCTINAIHSVHYANKIDTLNLQSLQSLHRCWRGRPPPYLPREWLSVVCGGASAPVRHQSSLTPTFKYLPAAYVKFAEPAVRMTDKGLYRHIRFSHYFEAIFVITVFSLFFTCSLLF